MRIYRAASGAVETVDFRAYLKNVLSREWISSWTTESLRAGALAVKHYAWYQVLHWRGFVSASGECFDLFDTARDQVYDPSRPVYAPMASAVDATWSTRALRNGSVLQRGHVERAVRREREWVADAPVGQPGMRP